VTDREKYQRGAASIQRDLSRYNYVSFVEQAIVYLSSDLGTENYRKQPWIIALGLKWSCVHGRHGTRLLEQKTFIAFCNRIYRLQAHAAAVPQGGRAGRAEFDINKNSSLLVLRPLLLNQYWYQKPSDDGLLYLARCHKLMCTKPVAQSYVAQEFQSKVGLSLDAFFRMALRLSTTLYLMSSETYVNISLADIIYKFHPTIPLEEIEAFIKFIAVDIRELPDFFDDYAANNFPTTEYFETTPLSYKPFIYYKTKLTALSPKVAINGLTELITDFFVKNDAKKFIKSFSRDFEQYTDLLFASSDFSYLDENAVDAIYKDNGIDGKKVDFVLQDETPVFIDAKAIQPNKVSLLSSANRNLYRDKLKSSFLKGFWQVQECRALFNRVNHLDSQQNFGLVVTHKDFYFVSARKYSELIDRGLEAAVIEKYGYLPIPLDRVYFITIKDLEDLLALQSTGMDLAETLESIHSDEKMPEGRRMNFNHHLSDRYDRKERRHDAVASHFDVLAKDVATWKRASKLRWDGSHGSIVELIHVTQTMDRRLDMSI